jgi:C4-dicarboxylate-specific signal transduction histidine kinase
VTAGLTKLQQLDASLPIHEAGVRATVMRYVLALVITAEIAALRYILDQFLNNNSLFSFFFVPVILAAWYLGLGPSLLNIVCGVVIAAFFFASRGSYFMQDPRQVSGTIAFTAISAYLAYLIHWLRRDIARRQKVEADLVATQELVQAHQAELAHAGRLSLMGEMTASLAHELNQPLHSARNYAQGSIRRMRKDPGADPEVLVALEKISEASDRAAEILRRVRDFVNKSSPSVARLDIGEMLHDAAMIADMGPAPQRAKVVFEVASDIPPVHGDKVEIEQVVVNLARNGLEAMDNMPPEERVLYLGARRSDEKSIEVFVRDSGPGIDADARETIFEPFFTTKADGMGMGLAICRSIVERHDGRLWFSTNGSSGTTFHFTLPCEENSVVSEAALAFAVQR